MAKVIWKFTLELTEEQDIDMPLGSSILSVGLQFERIQLWVMVDDATVVKKRRKIAIVGTGHKMDFRTYAGKFIGTVVTDSGTLVWHVFDASRGE